MSAKGQFLAFVSSHAYIITVLVACVLVTLFVSFLNFTKVGQNILGTDNTDPVAGESLTGNLHGDYTSINGTITTSIHASTSTHTSVSTSTIVIQTSTGTGTLLVTPPSQVGTVVGIATRNAVGVSLSWSAISGATGYNVYNGVVLLNASPILTTSYTTYSVNVNATYSFYVSALNGIVEGVRSSACVVTTLPLPLWQVTFLTTEPTNSNTTFTNAVGAYGTYNCVGIPWYDQSHGQYTNWFTNVSGSNTSGSNPTTAARQGGAIGGNFSRAAIVYETQPDINGYARSTSASRTIFFRYEDETRQATWLDNIRIGVLNSTLPYIYTKTIWLRFYDVTVNQNIFNSHSISTTIPFMHRVFLSNSLLYATQGVYGAPTVAIGDPSVPIVTNQWYFVAVCVYATKITTYLYNSANTVQLASNSTNINSANNFVSMTSTDDTVSGCEIGFFNSGGNSDSSVNSNNPYGAYGEGYRGYLDKPSVYPAALTASQVFSIFSAEK